MRCAWCGRETALVYDEDGATACRGLCKPPAAPTPKRLVSYEGEQLTLRQLARATGISLGVLSSRYSAGWDAFRLATTPAGSHGGHRHGPPMRPKDRSACCTRRW